MCNVLLMGKATVTQHDFKTSAISTGDMHNSFFFQNCTLIQVVMFLIVEPKSSLLYRNSNLSMHNNVNTNYEKLLFCIMQKKLYSSVVWV